MTPSTPLLNGARPNELIFDRDVVGLHKYLIDIVWIDEQAWCARSEHEVREERDRNRVRLLATTPRVADRAA